MPRRKAVEPDESLQPEIEQPHKGRKKLVEAEHTIKYSAPVPVTVEDEPPIDDDDDLLFDGEDDQRQRRKQKTIKQERESIKKLLAKNQITPASDLRLTIERYLHGDVSEDSGVQAEKEYCTKYSCTQDHLINEDYIEVARKYGTGRYWFTLRHKSQIVSQWEKRISGVAPAQPIIQTIPNPDPTQPAQIVYQMPSAPTTSAQPIGQIEPMKQLKELLQMQKLMREAVGGPDVQAPAAREETVTEQLLNHPKIFDTLVDTMATMAKKAAGVKHENNGDDSGGWVAVAMEIVKTNQVKDLAGVVQVAIQTALGGIIGGNNGQAQMVSPQFSADRQTTGQHSSPETGPQTLAGNQQISATSPAGLPSSNQPGQTDQASYQQTLAPEDQALQLVIDHCKRRLPPRIAFGRLMAYADAINEQAPQYSIDDYIAIFAGMTTEDALAFVKTLPGGAEIEALPHAREWTKEFQGLVQEGMEGEA